MPIEWKNVRRISRKDFLRGIGSAFIVPAVLDSPTLPLLASGAHAARAVAAVDAGFVMTRTAPGFFMEQALSTPAIEAPRAPEDMKGKIYPGSIEDAALAKVRDEGKPGLKLVDPKDNGPLPLITAAIFSDPQLLELTQMTVARQWELAKGGGRAGGGDLYLPAYEESLTYLEKTGESNSSRILSGTNIYIEADRRANYAVAAASAPHHSEEDARTLGIVPEGISPEPNSIYWFFRRDGYGRLTNPIIYGVENPEDDIKDGMPFEQGSERWGHLTYHAFLTASHRYFSEPGIFGKNGHPMKDAIPSIVKWGISLDGRYSGKSNPDRQARSFSKILGWLYEGKTTFSSADDPKRTDRSFQALMRIIGIGDFYANEGVLDSRLWEDIWANDLGADIALAKFHFAMKGINPKGLTDQLNDPKFKWTTEKGQQFLVPVGAGR